MSPVKPKINFNTKHLTKGDPLPPYNGKPRLFNMRYCPYAHRAVLALNAKNVDYEIINVDLKDKPEWLILKSTSTKVPALEITEGVSIVESLIIAEYLDDAYPERPLLSKDPLLKAYDRIYVESAGQIFTLVTKLIRADTVTDENISGFFKSLDLLQSHLQQRGTKFLGGDLPGYADYMIWPWFERLPTFNDERVKIDAGKYKLLLEYINNMEEDPVVKEYALTSELYQGFHYAYGLGKKPNYDRLLQQ